MGLGATSHHWKHGPCPASRRVYLIKATPARELGSIEAPDDAKIATEKAIEHFRIPEQQSNRLMVLRKAWVP